MAFDAGILASRRWRSSTTDPRPARPALFEPAVHRALRVAAGLRQVQPLVDIGLEGDVVARQQPGHLAVLQRLVGVDCAEPRLELLLVIASADSVTNTSARLARISSKIVTFSPCIVSLACLKLAPQALVAAARIEDTRTSGLSIATLWYLATSAQRAIGALPLTM